jgi:NAD-dependent deacetylase
MKEITPREAADLLRPNRRALALTGAGISVESGIPDFRSRDGLWSRFDPMEYATISAFKRDPSKVWVMLREMDDILVRARPNPAHRALAELEQRGISWGSSPRTWTICIRRPAAKMWWNITATPTALPA